MRTVVCVLAGNLCHCISDLPAHISDCLAGQTCHQLLTDGDALLVGQAQENLLDITRDGVFAGLGRNSSEEHSGESTGLATQVFKNQHVSRRTTSRWEELGKVH